MNRMLPHEVKESPEVLSKRNLAPKGFEFENGKERGQIIANYGDGRVPQMEGKLNALNEGKIFTTLLGCNP